MTHDDFRAALTELGLSQAGFARVLFGNARNVNVRRWAAGTYPMPGSVAIVIRLLLAGKITLDDVEAARSFDIQRPREQKSPPR